MIPSVTARCRRTPKVQGRWQLREKKTGMKVIASYYQQFDADPTLDVPGEGYGGWRWRSGSCSMWTISWPQPRAHPSRYRYLAG